MDERVGRDWNFFLSSFIFFLSFLSFFCCFVFQERVSLCILGCPRTHSVNKAILELTEICVWAEIKCMHRPPHTTAQPRLQFLVISGCPGLLVSEDGSVLWMFVNPDYFLPFNDMSLKHQTPTPILPGLWSHGATSIALNKAWKAFPWVILCRGNQVTSERHEPPSYK